ncbi:MAG: translation initiation factor IF-2 [Anaerolineales bacterium]|nr:translation initiation factor IF-2 [Anaerolineales bacterium]
MSENGKAKHIELPASITVRALAQTISASPIEVIKALMANGVMANINQNIDFDTAAIVAAEMGYEATLETTEETAAEDLGELPYWRKVIAKESAEKLVDRPPVVGILGHVDHGKTTLLDAIRNTSVAVGEVGGITQHIGAYQVVRNGRIITFLDTPGHAAFTAMRARGAQGADIVVLVVAADDGVMPQTREALAHAKAAKVPIIVAMNKIDRSNANPERVKRQLSEVGLTADDWGGDTMIVPVSAKQKLGLDDLLEAILLVADDMDIRANPKGTVIGSVIEAKRDRAKGVVATLLIQNGTLSTGDVVLAGTAYGRLKAMFDYRGNKVQQATPSTPVSVMGLSDVPEAGQLFQVVASERDARLIANETLQKQKEALNANRSKISLEKIFEQFKSGEVRELRLIIKADVQGSLEPIMSLLNDLSREEIGINILHAETGTIGENDVMLATASDAIIIGFSVQADPAARKLAESEGISIRLYDIIYRLQEDIEKALKGMLKPQEKLVVLGRAEVRATFKIPKVGFIAGCYVNEGEIRRNAKARVVRAGQNIFEGDFASLKHLSEDVREVRHGFECGIGLRNNQDIKVGDIIECFTTELVPVS